MLETSGSMAFQRLDLRTGDRGTSADAKSLVVDWLLRQSLGKSPAPIFIPLRRNAHVEIPPFAVFFQFVRESPKLQEVDNLTELFAL